MVSQAEALLIIRARDEASRTMQQFGQNVTRVQQTISRLNSIMSAFGIGAIVGVASVSQVVQRIQEWHRANVAFEQAQRRANLQVQLLGLSTDLLNERIRVLERTLGRTAATAMVQSEERTRALVEANEDLFNVALETARRMAASYGVEVPRALAALLEAHRGNFGPISELLGTQINDMKDLRIAIDSATTSTKSAAQAIGSWFGEVATGQRTIFAPFDDMVIEAFGPEGTATRTIKDFVQGFQAVFLESGPIATAYRAMLDVMGNALRTGQPLHAAAETLFTQAIPALFSEGTPLRAAWDEAVGWFGDRMADFQARTVTIFADIRRLVWGEGTPLRTSWETAVGWFGDQVGRIKQAFIDRMMEAKALLWDTPTSVLRRSWESFIDWMRARLQALINWANRHIPFGDPIPNLPGSSSSVPSTGGQPFEEQAAFAGALQRGGIVQRPTLALLGEAGPEAVVPLRRRPDILQPITVNVIVDGRIVKSLAVEGVREAFVRAGLGPGAFAPGV